MGRRGGKEGGRKEEKERRGKGESNKIPHLFYGAIFLVCRRFSIHAQLYFTLIWVNQGHTQHSCTHAPMLNGYKLPRLLVQKEITTDEEL